MAILVGVGTFLLFFALMMNAVALFVPWWESSNMMTGTGLWSTCTCQWLFTSSAVDFDGGTPWVHAVRWLFTAGVVLLVITMLVLFLISCCSEKSHAGGMIAAGCLVMLAAICIAIAVILFGVKWTEENGDSDSIIKTPQNHWAMWLGVGGFAMALVASIVLLAQGSRYHQR